MERHERLQKARRERGYATASDAAAAFGWNRNTYISNENGNAPFSFNKAKTYAHAFGVRAEWLYDGRGAMKASTSDLREIAGYAGADPEGAVLFGAGQGTGDYVPAPPNASSEAIALEIRGYSMPFFAEDGALVWVDDIQPSPTAEMVGQVVVCQLDTDEVLIKRLQRGSEKGKYSLASLAGPVRENVNIVWAGRIIMIIPPLEARRVIQRGHLAA